MLYQTLLKVLILSLLNTNAGFAQDFATTEQELSGRSVVLFGPSPKDWEGVKAPDEVTFLQIYDISTVSPSEARPLDDDTLKVRLSAFKNLRAILLFAPHATDNLFTSLSELEKLEVVAISKSRVTDDGLMKIRHAKKLRILAIWESHASENGARQLNSLNGQLNVEVTSDDKNGMYLNRSGYPTSALLKEIKQAAGVSL